MRTRLKTKDETISYLLVNSLITALGFASTASNLAKILYLLVIALAVASSLVWLQGSGGYEYPVYKSKLSSLLCIAIDGALICYLAQAGSVLLAVLTAYVAACSVVAIAKEYSKNA